MITVSMNNSIFVNDCLVQVYFSVSGKKAKNKCSSCDWFSFVLFQMGAIFLASGLPYGP